jgi:FkbH-like protein
MFYIKPLIPSLLEIEDYLDQQSSENLPKLRFLILRSVTIEPIAPYLRYMSYQLGYRPIINFGSFDNIVEEAIGSDSLVVDNDADIILIFTPIFVLNTLLDIRFYTLSEDQVNSELENILNILQIIISGVRSKSDATIMWHSLELPLYASRGIQDDQLKWGQSAIVSKINDGMRLILLDIGNAYFINMQVCLSRLGASNFYDIRYWYLASAPYSIQALKEIANEDFKYIRALKGINSKCLVLDCDNTLWGGVLGEDGIEGIKLGADNSGQAFVDFQNEILSLHSRGIIIALCSKNNENDVIEVFDKHPDMMIKREHISGWKINWGDKVSNICELAMDLNISIDSMVFVDDSDFEVNLVKQQLPEIRVLQLPINNPAEYRWILASCGWFDTPILTREDINRGAFYSQEKKRREFKKNLYDLETYCKSLIMKLTIGYSDDSTVSRIAQQTNKTNQFNLTTNKYSESDIYKFTKSHVHDVIWLKVSDKYGDMGIVGSCIIFYDNKRAIIDTFLISCRALGRGIEKRFLSEVMHIVSKRGVKYIYGQYVPSKKNMQTSKFYLNQKFKLMSLKGCKGEWYLYNLYDKIDRLPDYFSISIISVK